VKKIIYKILRLLGMKKIKMVFELIWIKSYLTETGFVKSYTKGFPVDRNDHNYPWWTYSFTDFLKGRLKNDMSIFEYGAGNSTIFLSNFVGTVTSVEHDELWYKDLKNKLKKNVRLIYSKPENYVDEIQKKKIKYDIVIIDGIKRNECAQKSIDYLSKRGVIIFDDTDRKKYEKSYMYLLDRGFKRIDFTGLAPCSINMNSTSVFYKEGNVLGI
jgi:hypothetical protein